MGNYFARQYERVQALMYRVFGWMATGLAVTGGAAYFVFHTPVLRSAVLQSPGMVFGLVLIQLALVFALSAAIFQMSYPVAMGMFVAYATLTGVTLSSIFMVYTMTSIATTFFVTAGMFGAMALYGATTRQDLSGLGTFFMMSLFGLIIALLVNMFLQSPLFQLAISACGVVIFAGLTAYDIQKIKRIAGQADESIEGNVAILGALQLYLDFINMFIYMLHIMGRRRQ